MSERTVDFARNPSPENLERRLTQPPEFQEMSQQLRALYCKADHPSQCTGQVHIGLFFDGTGNNEDADYTVVKNQPDKWKHTNVVRLFHAWPIANRLDNYPTHRFYKHYIPGVGTPFPKIGDDGGWMGSAFAWEGETRILWGLIQVMNSVHFYHSNEFFISNGPGNTLGPAGQLAADLGNFRSTTVRRQRILKNDWVKRLQTQVTNPYRKPKLVRINLSVFGFSRGAAEARVFINWFYELCEEGLEGWTFAGIPVQTQILGLFDTVASVGLSGSETAEGHQAWADDGQLLIHPAVRACVHMVAAHEQRAAFPLDSVRDGDHYPANCREYVYPGSHSDVGGGYAKGSQGKSEVFARIPGFEMYCEARNAGVPLLWEHELDELTLLALKPDRKDRVLERYRRYMEAAKVAEGPLEAMLRTHIGHYLTWRLHVGLAFYPQLGFMQQTRDAAEKKALLLTQKAFYLVLAGLSDEMQTRIDYPADDALHLRPLAQPFQEENIAWLDRLARLVPTSFVLVRITGTGRIIHRRRSALADDSCNEDIGSKASFIDYKLGQWRHALAHKTKRDPPYPELHDVQAAECDALSVLDTLAPGGSKVSLHLGEFMAPYVHDSMAGFAEDALHEFAWNGISLLKFRRLFFGRQGKTALAEHFAANNERAMAQFESERQKLRQWEREAAEFGRTR